MSTMNDMSLSLVIPCYNEAACLPQLIERCALLADMSDVDVVLVDNGSTDTTPDVFNRYLRPGIDIPKRHTE